MKPLFVIIFFLLPYVIFGSGKKESISLSSMQEQYSSGYFVTKPFNNRLIVIGISNPMLRRQEEIDAAKEDAARKVAMFYGIHGKIESVTGTNDNFFESNHIYNAELRYDSNYERFIEELTYDPAKDVLITNEGIFIRFQHETTVTSFNYNARLINNRPTWTRNQDKPEIEGYAVSVGFARNQRRLKDTINKSIEDAISRMIEDQSTAVNTRDVSSSGQGASSSIHTISEGKLNNFQIIEIWIEPGTRFVYTLAVARVER